MRPFCHQPGRSSTEVLAAASPEPDQSNFKTVCGEGFGFLDRIVSTLDSLRKLLLFGVVEPMRGALPRASPVPARICRGLSNRQRAILLVKTSSLARVEGTRTQDACDKKSDLSEAFLTPLNE